MEQNHTAPRACACCGAEFSLSEAEVAFFSESGMLPEKCAPCRKLRRAAAARAEKEPSEAPVREQRAAELERAAVVRVAGLRSGRLTAAAATAAAAAPTPPPLEM